MNIVIRTDASIEIGSGHVMRCLTLARQLERHGAKVTFFCRSFEGNSLTYLKEQGISVLALPPIEGDETDLQWIQKKWLLDAEQTIALIKDNHHEIDLLIVDHYGLDCRWESKLRHFTKYIMVIDDLANRQHDCDFLLDQNYYSNVERRYENLLPESCVQMLGPNYVLLREEFFKAALKPRERTGKIRSILVFFGGSDPTGETLKTIIALQELNKPELEIHVVVGASNPRRLEIERICNRMPNVQFYCQVSNMAELMRKADLAIGAGGATTWERCFLGLPAITIVVADNQLVTINLLDDEEVTLYIGESNNVSISMIKRNLIHLLENPEKVKQLSENSGRIINPEKVKSDILPRKILKFIGG